MNRTLKKLLLWLLIALLPFHAVAGSLGMSCVPADGQPPAAAAMQHQDTMAEAHAHHGGAHASHADESSSGVAAPASDLEKQSHGSCSACSSFCVGAVAPPSSDLALPSFDGSDAVLASPAPLLVGFVQDGPQRPPRH